MVQAAQASTKRGPRLSQSRAPIVSNKTERRIITFKSTLRSGTHPDFPKLLLGFSESFEGGTNLIQLVSNNLDPGLSLLSIDDKVG